MENPSEEIELAVDDTTTSLKVPQQQNHTAVWDKHCYENQMAIHDDTDNSWGTNSYYTNSWNPTDAWNDGNAASTTTYNTQPVVSAQHSKPKSFRQPPPPPTQQQPQQRTEAKKDGFSNLFIQETAFPSWDD